MWRENVPLGNVLSTIKDGTHGTHERVKRGVPFLSAKNITEDGQIIWSDDDSYITESEYNLIHTHFKLEPNDIMLTIVGTIGRRAIYRGEKVTFQRSVAYLRPKQNEVLPNYLFQLFGSKKFTYLLLDRANTTAQPGLYLGQLAEIEIDYPADLSEQKAIADVLDTVDEAIAATQAMLDKQNKIKDGLLQDLLTRGVDQNGKLRPHPEDAPNLYKSSPLGLIPKDWDATTINDMAIHVGSGITPRGGSAVYKKSGIIFIRSQNVHNDGLKLEDVAYITDQIHSEMASSRVFPNDVLLNITGASIGRCCPLPEDFDEANVNQHVCSIRLPKSNKSDAKFLSMTLSSFIGQNQIARFNAGSNREGLNFQQIRSFDIPWPQQKERERIAKTYEGYQNQKNNVLDEMDKLKKLKSGLMQDLLTGKKRIPVKQKEAA